MGNNYSNINNIVNNEQQYQQQQYQQQYKQQQPQQYQQPEQQQQYQQRQQQPQQYQQHQQYQQQYQQQYPQQYQQQNKANILGNINDNQIKELSKMSPYKLLNIDSSASLSDLKSKFKELVNITHPDKGGNKELFNILRVAYKQIENDIYNRDNTKSQLELKDNFKNDSNEILKSQKKMKFEIGSFNKMYEENNDNSSQHGYIDFLKNDEVFRQKNNNKSIVNYQIPNSYNNNNYGCNSIIEDNNNNVNYSNKNYSDIKEAYSEQEKPKVPDDIFNRKILDLEVERQNLKMTEEEHNKYNSYLEYNKKKNEEYYQKVKQNDTTISNRYNHLNRKMINM